MPYIKPEYRPPFDAILAKYAENYNWLFNSISNIIKEADKHKLKDQDGCINYVLSKAFLTFKDVEIAEVLASLTIITKYLSNDTISYFNIERAKGLLGCMMDEFMKRKWYERENGHDVFEAHKRMIGQLRYIQDNYETDKQKLNGDIIEDIVQKSSE